MSISESDSLPEAPMTRPSLILRIDTTVVLQAADLQVRLSPTQQCYLLLVAHGGQDGLRRDEAIGLLWDDIDSPATRHRIRQLNYAINRRAGRPVIRVEGSTVSLQDAVTVHWMVDDVGSAMSPPTARFADRLVEIRDERQRLAALGSVRDLDAGRLEDQPDRVLESIRKGPRTAGSWRDLLWALLRTGRVREAEFELRRVIGDDLPIESLPTARRVAAKADRLLTLAAAGTGPPTPLLGRDSEVRHVHDLLVSGAACTLITGARGVGRSRILGQAIATLLTNQDDTIVLAARGVSFERHTPFGGLGQLLSDELLIQAFRELGQPETEIISRALPVQFETEESHTLAQLGGPGSYLRIAQAISKLLDIAFGNAEVILLVDDMDVLDRSTVEVVTRLILISDARLLATWCTEDEGGLSELLFRFRGVAPEVVPLLDLQLPQAVSLAQAVVPSLGERDAEELARLGGGRPGRIVELLNALDGASLRSGPVGPSLDELLRRRVRDLSPVEQEVLTLLAVGAGQLDIPVLGALLGCGVLEASGHIRTLEEAGLAKLETGRATVTSNLLREFVERELPGPVRRETHALIADHLLVSAESEDPAVLAHHLMQSGRPVEAAGWFKRAGFRARDRTAFAEARVLLERSVEANDELDPEIAQALGAIQSGMGEFKQAIHWFGRARIGYVERGDQLRDIEVALQEVQDRAALFATLRREYQRVLHVGCPQLTSAVVDVWLSAADHFHAREELQEGLQHLRGHLSMPDGPRKFAFVGARLTYLGSPTTGLRLAVKSYLASRQDPEENLKSLHRLLLCLWARGQFQRNRAWALVEKADRLATGAGNLSSRIALWSALGLWHLDSGRWGEAESCLSRAQSGMVMPADLQRGAMAVNHAILAVRTENIPGAEPHIANVNEMIPFFGRTIEMLSKAVRLLVALEFGRLAEAKAWGMELESCDLSFPFASNLALVPEALAELMRRQGHSSAALAYLRQVHSRMADTNVPCGLQLSEKIRELEAST
jgi:tetratricopeptide (TPR) repeat protein